MQSNTKNKRPLIYSYFGLRFPCIMDVATRPSHRFLEQLQQIHQTAVEIRESVATHIGSTPLDTLSRSRARNPPSYHLPEAVNIVSRLVDSGASLDLAKSISDVYERHATELRSRIDDFIKRLYEDPAILSSASDEMYDSLLHKLVDGRIRFYTDQLQTWTAAAISQVQIRVVASTAQIPQKKVKKTFNHVCLINFILFVGLH